MSLLPVAIWGLQVKADGSIFPAVADIPATFRVTMAALDPTAKPKDSKQPLRSTLKILRRPLQNPDFNGEDDETDSDSETESDSEEEAQPVKGKKRSKKGDAPAKKADKSDEEDMDDEDGLSDDGEYEIEEFTICTLDTERNYQQPLDIVVGEDEECFFKVVGNFDISLTGNYVVGSGDADKYDEDSEDGEDEDDYDLSPDEDELELYGDDSDSDDLDDIEDPRIQEIDTDDEAEAEIKGAGKKAEKLASKKVEKIEKKAEKAEKNADKKSLKRSADESEGEDLTLADLIAKAKEVKEAAAAAAPEKKLSKKQLKKLKANDGKAVDATADKTKKVQFAKELEQGPTPSTSTTPEKKTEKKSAEKPVTESSTEKKKAEPKRQKVVQGITIMDSKIGTGPAAKKGNKLAMRYIGKLDNGKVFDSNTKGKPFTFQLGKGEVIAGWDIGLEGMQVGGERRLRIPPASAYGKKALPGIPSNSVLVFDVKLIEIK